VRLFKDEACAEPLEAADFGETWLLEAKTLKIWLLNDTKAFLRDISVEAGEDVEVEAPASLKSMGKAPVTFTWKPNGLKGLKGAVTIHAVEVYGP
jgi:hypothetical protein